VAKGAHPDVTVLAEERVMAKAGRWEPKGGRTPSKEIVQGAHQRFLRIVDDINELKRQRVQFESGLKALADSHLRLLEAFREAPAEEAVPFAAARKKLASDDG
jgi:hypothetical protein